MKQCLPLLLLPALGLTLLATTACEVDSANKAVRTVNVNVAGAYVGVSTNQPLVQRNSGAPVTLLNLRQNGDALEATDNNNRVYRGTIGSASGGNSVSFNLVGSTTVEKSVTVSGNITVAGNEGTMSGTWIEQDFYSVIFGKSTGQSVITNTPTPTNGVTIGIN